ncbi:MAG: hypothetical protein V4484_03645 [Pseudomonadota bacterium]
MQLTHARILFYLAAGFNFLAVALLSPAPGIAQALGVSPSPGTGLFDQIALMAIALFGAGYWMVARNPARNGDLVKLGMAGKLIVPAIVATQFMAGGANARLLALVSGDLLFAAAFLYFLVTRK